MKAIRANHPGNMLYWKIFQEEAKITNEAAYALKDKAATLILQTKPAIQGGTNILTATRAFLADSGYASAVEKADARFILERKGPLTEEEWERYWERSVAVTHEVYPADAL